MNYNSTWIPTKSEIAQVVVPSNNRALTEEKNYGQYHQDAISIYWSHNYDLLFKAFYEVAQVVPQTFRIDKIII